MNYRVMRLAAAIIGVGATGVGGTVGCSDGATAQRGEAIGVARQALVQTFALPIPVGLSPQDIVIGATNAVNINDGGFVNTVAPQALATFWGNIAAFGPGTAWTNLGRSSQVGAVFANTSLMMRGGTLEFFKTNGATSTQAGTAFRQPLENVTSLVLRQDRAWTVTITPPDTGTDRSVNAGETVELPDGNYGNVNVNSGGTLRLTGTSYGFVGLTLNSASTVQLTSPSPTRFFIRNTLIMRTAVNKPGTTIGYLGTASVPIEAGGFQGDLFLAPNADVDIKANSVGRFFARNVTVFENVNVRGPALSQDAQNRVRPTDSFIRQGGANGLAPFGNDQQAEISSAILTVAHSPSCTVTRPLALTTFDAPQLIRSPGLLFNSSSTTQSLNEPTGPTLCLGELPGTPEVNYTIRLEAGTPSYGPKYTDNVTARLPGGRALEVGLEGRFCLDATQSPNCPATQPTAGTACSDQATAGACYYGSNFALCSGGVWQIDTHGCPAVKPTTGGACSSSANPVTCWYTTLSAQDYCRCSAGSDTWFCGSRKRLEGRYFAVRMTSNCGPTPNDWATAALDPQIIGITDGTNASRVVDRQELHVDPIANRVYLAFQTSPVEDGFGAVGSRDIVLSGDANSTTAGAMVMSLSSSLAAPGTEASPVLARNMPLLGSYQPMATVRDERALMPNGTIAPWSHLLRLQCIGNPISDAGATPRLDVTTPFGVVHVDVSGGDPARACRVLFDEKPGAPPVANVVPGLQVVAVQGAVPRARVAWSGVVNGFQMVFIANVNLRRVNNYSQPIVTQEFTIQSPTAHILWPQFIAPDHFSGSDMLLDTPTVIRWAQVNSTTVTEQAVVLYAGLLGQTFNMAQWAISDAFPGRTCPGLRSNGTLCFAGDYRYGAFWERTPSGTLTYYTPWTGFSSSSPMGSSRMRAFGGRIDVVP